MAAFKILLNNFPGDAKQFIIFSYTNYEAYTFFDSVHLVKNITKNLLSAKKFVFPEFDFEIAGKKTCTEAGFICWRAIPKTYEKDQKLSANLKTSSKVILSSSASSDKEKNHNLALVLFHETTMNARRCYFPQQHDTANFL